MSPASAGQAPTGKDKLSSYQFALNTASKGDRCAPFKGGALGQGISTS